MNKIKLVMSLMVIVAVVSLVGCGEEKVSVKVENEGKRVAGGQNNPGSQCQFPPGFKMIMGCINGTTFVFGGFLWFCDVIPKCLGLAITPDQGSANSSSTSGI